jgi:7-carboxy-7-deazaguanine synthase (Cx14CxxC type)
MYKVKEIYYTLQGEGAHSGQPAIFCRFTGCNLWSGREEDRYKAICTFCDTDFIGTDGVNGGHYTTESLVNRIKQLWPTDSGPIWVVFTGGEPLLQLDKSLIDACHLANVHVAIETNGTLEAPEGIDWLCVSPKSNTELLQTFGDELKLVFPQSDCLPEQFEALDFEVFSLQPMDGESAEENIKATIAYCMEHPKWRLSLQTHKMLGIP